MSRTRVGQIIAAFVLIASLSQIGAPAATADGLSYDRANCKQILKNVASDVQKNFYDEKLKGLDWNAVVEEAKTKIENANSVNDMMAAIYVAIDKLHDSHTKFMPPARSTKLYLGFDAKAIGDEIRVYELKEGDPAVRAGLKLGDKLISVNGFRPGRQSFDIMMMDFKVLRPRAAMDLVVQTGDEAPRNIHIEARLKKEAALLEQATLTGDIWDSITESENYSQDHLYHSRSYSQGQIGYTQLRAFVANDSALRDFLSHNAGAKAIILDLRSNPGGSVDTLKKMIGCFEQGDVTVLNEVGRKKTEPMIARPQKPNFAVPMFILVDSRTGSAAEIFARHFQRTGKAVIIGDHTSGRVTVSRTFTGLMGGGNAIPFGSQIGIARAVFPDGSELENVGVTPDVACIPTGTNMLEEDDVCLGKAVSLAREKLGLKPEVVPVIEKRTL